MISILLVEDDKDLNELVSSYLRKSFYDVTSVFNGLDALNEFEEQNYDLILSGDLSKFGKELFVNICDANNIDIKNIYNDCGLMIYDLDKQDVHSGGSGSGCLPAVCFSYIINEMKNGKIKRVLLLATGALHNPSILNQKESIPGICHAISIERE